MADRIDLDHVAVAAEHALDNLDRYRGDLGGDWFGGGVSPGYYWGQVGFANGMRLELLQPCDVHRDDFLRRFLDRNGPGPHHVTFAVPDIRALLDRARAAGFEPVGVNIDRPRWKEAFLHPKQSHGIVVQLAEKGAGDGADGDGEEAPLDLPPPRVPWQANLVRVVHLVADLDGARALFADLLGGEPVDEGDGGGGRFVDLRWPGPGRIRLVQPADPVLTAWLGGRSGRVHHLEVACPEPAGVRRARPVGEGLYEVRPEDNLGVRLRLAAG